MTGISSSPTDAAGFTLIELLVVLGIIGLLGTVAAVQWRRSPAVSPEAGRIMKIRSELRTARQEALAGGRPVAVEAARLSPGVTWQKGTALIFHPDGTASGDILLVDGKPRLAVDWVSGFVHAAR
jgi:prepilin-type N-terminal cleavage/methylation domain-containing protein